MRCRGLLGGMRARLGLLMLARVGAWSVELPLSHKTLMRGRLELLMAIAMGTRLESLTAIGDSNARPPRARGLGERTRTRCGARRRAAAAIAKGAVRARGTREIEREREN